MILFNLNLTIRRIIMKKIFSMFFMLIATLTLSNAQEATGESVFKAKCVACHTLSVKDGMSDEERMKMMKTLKAPPMSKVSAKVRNAFNEDVNKSVAFVADYIVNPDANKSLCMPMALKKFGVMPAIGKAMTKEEIEVVSKWLVSNFDEKWSDIMETKCKGKDKNSPCCAGKNKKEKCGTGKCGGEKMPKHPGMKCGSGKCGGEK